MADGEWEHCHFTRDKRYFSWAQSCEGAPVEKLCGDRNQLIDREADDGDLHKGFFQQKDGAQDSCSFTIDIPSYKTLLDNNGNIYVDFRRFYETFSNYWNKPPEPKNCLPKTRNCYGWTLNRSKESIDKMLSQAKDVLAEVDAENKRRKIWEEAGVAFRKSLGEQFRVAGEYDVRGSAWWFKDKDRFSLEGKIDPDNNGYNFTLELNPKENGDWEGGKWTIAVNREGSVINDKSWVYTKYHIIFEPNLTAMIQNDSSCYHKKPSHRFDGILIADRISKELNHYAIILDQGGPTEHGYREILKKLAHVFSQAANAGHGSLSANQVSFLQHINDHLQRTSERK